MISVEVPHMRVVRLVYYQTLRQMPRTRNPQGSAPVPPLAVARGGKTDRRFERTQLVRHMGSRSAGFIQKTRGSAHAVVCRGVGSIGDYCDSLVRLRCFGLRALYPGHGKISTTPIKDIDQQSLTHRKFLTNRAPRVPRYSFKSCGRMTVTRTVNSPPEVVTRINL